MYSMGMDDESNIVAAPLPLMPERHPVSPWYSRIILFLLCILPVVAALAPRLLAYLPGLTGLGGTLAFRYLSGHWPDFPRRLFVWIGACVALCAASALWAIDPAFALLRSGKIALILLGGGLLVALARSAGDREAALFGRFFPIAVLAAGALCLFNLYANALLYQLLHGDVRQDIKNFSFLNRSTVFFTLCLFTALAVAASRERALTRRSLLVALGLVTAPLLYKTHSQSAQAAFAVGLLGFLLFPYGRKAAWFVLGGGLCALLLSAPFLAQFLFKHAALPLADMSWFSKGYAANRLEIWDFISRKALEHPFHGFGVEATRFIKDFETARLYTPSSEVLHPHNFALQLWIEFGVPGALLGAGFLNFVLLRIHALERRAQRMALPTFLAVLFAASTAYGLWQSWWLGTFCALAAFSIFGAKALRTKVPAQ